MATFVPRGSQIVSIDPLEIEYADYDYGPFEDPTTPAFDFIADLVHDDGTIERDVTCTSHPGRRTTLKEN